MTTTLQTRDVHPMFAQCFGQRRRRWANIEPALCEGLVFAGQLQSVIRHYGIGVNARSLGMSVISDIGLGSGLGGYIM